MCKIKDFLFKKHHLHKKTLIILLVLAVAFSCFLVYDNFSLDVEIIQIKSEKAQALKGFKIAHISDYHNRGSEIIDSAILESLKAEKPDVIFLTGDLIDKTRTDISVSLYFVKTILELAPVYYVTGNHECNVSIESQSDFDNMISELSDMGVKVLRQSGEAVYLPNGESINVYGIDDPYFHCYYSSEITDTTDSLCSELQIDGDEFNILLAHHPEQLAVYARYGFDLVFSGHAHGGQGRLFGQGLIAPDQGFFPAYTSGLYNEGNTKLVLSRGIGNSIVPVRVFNKSHLIFVEF